jgi:hypothetical protein
MNKYTHFSARASLAAVGLYLRQQGIWELVGKHVHIKQKIIRHKPLDKLLDAFINILAGGQGLVEVNTRVRPDHSLQRAFGRDECAEQSVVSDTLNACTEETVNQMRKALQEVYHDHSQGYRHKYEKSWQVLDVDMSGMPAGRQGEGVTKGYFSGQRGRRGRQLGRVYATLYNEIVVERLYPGKVQLERSLQALVTAAEEVLNLKKSRRQRTIMRVDGGGGRDADINWLLNRGYFIIAKVKNWQRSVKLAHSVVAWHSDPRIPGREIGWVTEPHTYDRATRQLAIRKRKKNGKWQYRILVFNLTEQMLFWLADLPYSGTPTMADILFAAIRAYDLRGGGVETSFKDSKQGLGLTKRNKRRFAAQEMLVLLAQLAYNLITWTRNRLAHQVSQLRQFGVLRMVRDVFHIPGSIMFNDKGHILQITLNQAHCLAALVKEALQPFLARDGTLLNLGQI